MTTDADTSPRIVEITSWLRSNTTVAKATEQISQFDDIPDTRSRLQRAAELIIIIATGLWVLDLFWRFKEGPRIPGAIRFAKWAESNMMDGDELWEYDTGGDSWEMLAGECGFAIVRDGKVVDFWMRLMN